MCALRGRDSHEVTKERQYTGSAGPLLYEWAAVLVFPNAFPSGPYGHHVEVLGVDDRDAPTFRTVVCRPQPLQFLM